jgi:two-component system, NarL family, nitrate/nitrite response regulator NarL
MKPRAHHVASVLLADDHPFIRLAVREDLEQAGFRVCAEAATAEEAIAGALRETPDLCLLDVSMPGDGLYAAAEIQRQLPGTKVVMLTASDSEEHFLDALRSGAYGYLLKDDDPTRLAIALRDVLNGIPAFPRRLTGALLLVARAALASPTE